MLTHKEVLNTLLADACPSQLDIDGTGFNLYTIELHCSVWQIEARPVNDSNWKIKGIKRV